MCIQKATVQHMHLSLLTQSLQNISHVQPSAGVICGVGASEKDIRAPCGQPAMEYKTDAVVAIHGEIDGNQKFAVDTVGDVVVMAPTDNPRFFVTLTARFTDGQEPDFDFLTDACVMSLRVLDNHGETLSITPATEQERSL